MTTVRELPHFLLLDAQAGDTEAARKLIDRIADMIDQSDCFKSCGGTEEIIKDYFVSALKKSATSEKADIKKDLLLKKRAGRSKYSTKDSELSFVEFYLKDGRKLEKSGNFQLSFYLRLGINVMK